MSLNKSPVSYDRFPQVSVVMEDTVISLFAVIPDTFRKPANWPSDHPYKKLQIISIEHSSKISVL